MPEYFLNLTEGAAVVGSSSVFEAWDVNGACREAVGILLDADGDYIGILHAVIGFLPDGRAYGNVLGQVDLGGAGQRTPAPGDDTFHSENVCHIVSRWSALREFFGADPRALCGASLTAEPGDHYLTSDAPICPDCASRAGM